jgi:hypothetical protein
MAQLPGTFDPAEIPDDDYSLIPPGRYLAQVIESKLDDTRNGTGQILTLTFEIMEGEFERRRVWERLNIVNANPDAQRIAQQSLKRLCDASGAGAINDSEELHFKPVVIDVGIRQDKSGQYRDQNSIKGYYPAQAAPAAAPARQTTQRQPAAAPAQQQRPAAAPAQANGQRRPWGQRATA